MIEAPCSPADRESPKCKEIIPFYWTSLANPAASYGECARPVEFPSGNPIPQGSLEHFQDPPTATADKVVLVSEL